MLDTHALLWWLADSERLSRRAFLTIADEANEVLVSAASAWEIATEYRLGKLPGGEAVAIDVAGRVAGQGFGEQPTGVADAERAGRLPGPLRDPFDGMPIARAPARDPAIVSNERPFDRYGVNRLWRSERPGTRRPAT